jgi:hypothetical protein
MRIVSQGGMICADLKIVPITLKVANSFVIEHHRHHDSCTGCRFAIGVIGNGDLIGVCICGRPVSRYLDDGLTLEVNRCCVKDGFKNACSKLYGACCRIAKEMGYIKVITYTLESEEGTSLVASNFTCEGVAGGKIWTGIRNRDNGVPKEMKKRWVRML